MSSKTDKSAPDLSTDVVDNSTGEIFTLPYIRTAYDGSAVAASNASVLYFDPDVLPSMTKQSFVEECDINTILKRFTETGLLTHAHDKPPIYGDFTSVSDYQTSMQLVIDAHMAFDALPAALRDRFHNDPEKFLAFVADDANYDEAVKLGLITPPPLAVEPVDAQAATTPAGGDPQRPQGAGGGASPASP